MCEEVRKSFCLWRSRVLERTEDVYESMGAWAFFPHTPRRPDAYALGVLLRTFARLGNIARLGNKYRSATVAHELGPSSIPKRPVGTVARPRARRDEQPPPPGALEWMKARGHDQRQPIDICYRAVQKFSEVRPRCRRLGVWECGGKTPTRPYSHTHPLCVRVLWSAIGKTIYELSRASVFPMFARIHGSTVPVKRPLKASKRTVSSGRASFSAERSETSRPLTATE